MNRSTLTETITDHIPSRAAAASTISSTFDDVAGHLPDLHLPDLHLPELPDLSKTVRRTQRAAARAVPWMSTRRSHKRRWLMIGAAVVVVVAVIAVVRRRSTPEPEATRDDWTIPPTDGSRPASDANEREPATSRT